MAVSLSPHSQRARWQDCAGAPHTDAGLIALSQRGDVDAFNVLIERYQHRVYAVAFRIVGAGDADDVTQDVLLAAYRGIRRYQGGSFSAWLLRIATNTSLDVLRARARRPTVSLDGDPDGGTPPLEVRDPRAGPDEHVVGNELARALAHQLGKLPFEQRLVIILSDLQGYSYDEITAVTGWSTGTVKSRLSRGHARLRTAIGAQTPDFHG